jgi:hypothetical protein
MAGKRTKGKTTKDVARKRVTKIASAKRRTGEAAKKPRKPAGITDLLRSWSPSRYSTR